MYFPSRPIATLCSEFLTPATYRVCIHVGAKKKKNNKKRKLSYFIGRIKSDLDRWGGKTFFKNPISLNYSYSQKMPGDVLHQCGSAVSPWTVAALGEDRQPHACVQAPWREPQLCCRLCWGHFISLPRHHSGGINLCMLNFKHVCVFGS